MKLLTEKNRQTDRQTDRWVKHIPHWWRYWEQFDLLCCLYRGFKTLHCLSGRLQRWWHCHYFAVQSLLSWYVYYSVVTAGDCCSIQYDTFQFNCSVHIYRTVQLRASRVHTIRLPVIVVCCVKLGDSFMNILTNSPLMWTVEQTVILSITRPNAVSGMPQHMTSWPRIASEIQLA